MPPERVIKEIEPAELERLFSSGTSVALLDVREPEEIAHANFPGSLVVPRLIPLMEIPDRLAEVKEFFQDPHIPAICFCRVGVRSGSAIKFLNENGIFHIRNLRGGINAYAREIGNGVVAY